LGHVKQFFFKVLLWGLCKTEV